MWIVALDRDERARSDYRRWFYALRGRVVWAGGVVDDVTLVAGSLFGPIWVILGDRDLND